MPQLVIRKAERYKSKLRLALSGPSGSGKTMSALKLALGLGKKVCLIDTERGSGDLYADLFDYDVITLEPPYKPEVYCEAIKTAEAAGYDVIIIDSLSHGWADEGGILDQADKLSSGSDRFRVWSQLTPQHRLLVNTMLGSTSHIIATMRSKQEYAMDRDEKTGKSRVVKMGMAPVQRDGIEYEFTITFDINSDHNATATKDRTGMFTDEVLKLDEKAGGRIKQWLESGSNNTRPKSHQMTQAERDTYKGKIVFNLKRLGVYTSRYEGLDPKQKMYVVKRAIFLLTQIQYSEEDDTALKDILQRLETMKDFEEAQYAVYGSDEAQVYEKNYPFDPTGKVKVHISPFSVDFDDGQKKDKESLEKSQEEKSEDDLPTIQTDEEYGTKEPH